MEEQEMYLVRFLLLICEASNAYLKFVKIEFNDVCLQPCFYLVQTDSERGRCNGFGGNEA